MRTLSTIASVAFATSLSLGACSSPLVAPGVDDDLIDAKRDPCQDFYAYACGRILNAEISEGYGGVTNRAKLIVGVAETVRGILEADQGDVGAFYASCMDAPADSGGRGRAEALRLVDEARSLQGEPSLARGLARLHLAGVFALFSFYTSTDLRDATKQAGGVALAGMSLPTRADYIDPTYAAVVQRYGDHVKRLARLFDEREPEAMAAAVVRIERALAEADLPEDEARDPARWDRPGDAAALQAEAPGFDWPAYLSELGVPDGARIYLAPAGQLQALSGLLARESRKDLALYVAFRAMERSASAAGGALLEEEYRFHTASFGGSATPSPRWRQCVPFTEGTYPVEVGRAFVRERGWTGDDTKDAEAMVEGIRTSMHARLTTVDWLDEPTRAAALAKLGALRFFVGAPGAGEATSGRPPLGDGPYLEKVLAITRHYRRYAGAYIGKDVDREQWITAASTVNAFYSSPRNAVFLPAAIFGEPYYARGWALGARLGALGSVVGHEITHGFDDGGRKYDAEGDLRDWWSEGSREGFAQRSKCLVDQYEGYEVVPGVHVDGLLTLGENLADLGGVKLAYAALTASADDTHSGKDGRFTPEQTFFLAYAQTHCSKVRPGIAALMARTDTHAPDRDRVNGVLTNVPDFARAFRCAETTPMAPKDRCVAW